MTYCACLPAVPGRTSYSTAAMPRAATTLLPAPGCRCLVDVPDRRPVVLSAADTALWLGPAPPFDQAEQLLRSVALVAESFAWHAIARAVGNVRNHGAQVAVPVVV